MSLSIPKQTTGVRETRVPLDSLGHPMPPPCPSECIDVTPKEMWGAYWRASRDGEAGVPARMPAVLRNGAKGWFPFARRCREACQGELPSFWKGYWGKFCTDRGGGWQNSGIPSVSLPDEFWEEYMERFPEGHGGGGAPQAASQPTGTGHGEGGGDTGKHGYVLISGNLCYKHPNGLTYEASGVDSFPSC